MSPILTRPVREQLEHDRVIRLLQVRYKRKTEVIINPAGEQNQSVTVENLVVFPDLLIFAEGGKKLLGTVEVETGESVNSLEARAEWGVFCKLKVPMHLYVPAASVDTARRLIAEYSIPVAEVWSFHASFDQIRFTMIYRSPDAPVVKLSSVPSKPPLRQGSGGQAGAQAAKAPAPAAKPAATAAKPAPKPAAKPAPKAKAAAKPAAKAKAKSVVKAKPKKPAKVTKPVKVTKPAKKSKPGKPTKPAKKRR